MKHWNSTAKKITAALLLVALAAGLTWGVTWYTEQKNGPARLVQTYVQAVNDRDFDAFCRCLLPTYQKDLQKAAEQKGGQALMEENYQSAFGSGRPGAALGEDVRLTVTDLQTEQITPEGENYRGIDLVGLEVSEVANVRCTVTSAGTAGSAAQKVEAVCVRIGRQWYLYTMVGVSDPVTATDAGQ